MVIGKHYDLDTDGTLANNSDNVIASQKAIKTYVDTTKPTVNNSTILLTQGGVNKGSFTLNQSINSMIDFDKSTELILVDNSGASLPTPQTIGETFLNTTDKKIYTSEPGEYVVGSDITKNGNLDLSNGEMNNFSSTNYLSSTSLNRYQATLNLDIHFKTGLDVTTKQCLISMYGYTPSQYKHNGLGAIYIENSKLYVLRDANSTLTEICDIQINKDYHIEGHVSSSYGTGYFDDIHIKENDTYISTLTTYATFSYPTYSQNTNYTMYIGVYRGSDGIITAPFLEVLYGDTNWGGTILVSEGDLGWDDGVALSTDTICYDNTNEIIYLYKDSELITIEKPTIPTVNNSTITIQKNGTAVDSFTLNQSSDKNINITMSKSDVGLGNVDNTSDANKPISTATQTELNKKIQQNDILQNLNQHNSSDRTRIWLSSLDNTLYRANKRFTVTLTNFDTTDSTNLFDMNWDSDVRISSGKIGTINITGATNLGMSYPYGYIYVSFYGGNSPTNISQISGRMYQNWSGHNTGWVNLSSFTTISTGTYGGVEHIKVARVAVGTYGIQQIEINIDNTDGVGYQDTKIWMTQVEFFCSRTGIGSLPVLTKRGGDTIYGNLTIPTTDGSFIGNLNGNANTATKATKDDDGNTISTTYLKASEIPTQSGNSGKFLTTNGSTMSWANASLVKFRDWSD